MVKTEVDDFRQKIHEDARGGTYRVNVGALKLDVFPYVFPPESPLSQTSLSMNEHFGDLSGKKVLDIGTGTGILAIQAAKGGALSVDAVDIMSYAVDCALHNADLNNVKINAYQSDMFSRVKCKYDLIVANLPIQDVDEEDLRFHSFVDPGFNYHKRFFEEVHNYLKENGRIIMCHANFSPKESFCRLEKLAIDNGLEFDILENVPALHCECRSYEFRSKGMEESSEKNDKKNIR